MTKLEEDFNLGDSFANTKSKLSNVINFWYGANTTNSYTTWGEARRDINRILPLDIAPKSDNAASFITKLNDLNEPDRLLSNTLSASIFIANNIINIFNDNGIQQVASVNSNISLVTASYKGLSVNTESVINGTFDSATSWSLGAGWSVTGGKLVGTTVGGFVSTLQSNILTIGKNYIIQITDFTKTSGTALQTGSGSVNPQVDLTSTGSYRHVANAIATNYGVRPDGAGNFSCTIEAISIRELLDYISFQNTITRRPKLGVAPKRINQILKASENFSSSRWVKGALSVSEVTPGDASAGWRLIEDSTSAIHSIYQIMGFENGWLQLDFQFDTGDRGMVVYTNNDNDDTSVYIRYNGLPNIFSKGPKVFDESITELGGGWYRLRYRATLAPGGAKRFLIRLLNTAHSYNYQGNGTSSIKIRYPQFSSSLTNYQYSGSNTALEITEQSSKNNYLYWFDGTDDRLDIPATTGPLVDFFIFGKRGSIKVKNLQVPTNTQLQIGPRHVGRDEGAIHKDLAQAVELCGNTFYSFDGFGIVGYAITKANTTNEESESLLQMAKGYGASGWITFGNNILTNGDFASDVDGWNKFDALNTLSWDSSNGGRAVVDRSTGASGYGIWRSLSCDNTKVYIATANINPAAASARAMLQLKNGSSAPDASGTLSDTRTGVNYNHIFGTVLYPTGSDMVVAARSRDNVSGPIYIDDIEIREIIFPTPEGE